MAVPRSITSSYLVDASTGRSPGLFAGNEPEKIDHFIELGVAPSRSARLPRRVCNPTRTPLGVAHEAGVERDWVTGVSIGAINCAIIAGNRPERRVERLRTFWERINERKVWSYTPDGDIFRKLRNATSSWVTVQGQPGFFAPRNPSPWLSFPGAQSATSYYDNAPVADTLDELVDFSLINDKAIRLAVGAVNVLNGNFIYFDNAHEDIGTEHIMASGHCRWSKSATDHFGDGGIVFNTPLHRR